MPAISLKEILLNEFNRETATARKLLEQVPIEKAEWKPHGKSSPLGRLAIHVAQLPGMGVAILKMENRSSSGPSARPEIKTTVDLVKIFDDSVEATRKALEETTDERLAESWKLISRERVVFEGPRVQAFQTLMLNHFIHHRAQLGVYLRLNDIAIPGSYGPSADEPM